MAYRIEGVAGERFAPLFAPDAGIRALLEDPAIAGIHAHNAAHGCLLAKVERD